MKHTHVARCAENGCEARTFVEFRSRREMSEELRRLGAYRCVRHSRPGEVLTLAEPERVCRLSVVELQYGKFWGIDGRAINGFLHGPGFMAYAKDFAPGTTIEVTARIIPRAKP